MANSGKLTANQITIYLLVGLNVMLLSYLLFFQPSKEGSGGMPVGPERGGRHIEKFIREELGFSEAQMNKFFEIRESQHNSMRAKNQRLLQLKDQFFAQLKHESGGKVVDSLAQEIGRLHMDIDRTTFDHFSEIRGICNPEQKEKFDLLIDDLLRRNAPGGRPGREGMRPPPHRKP